MIRKTIFSFLTLTTITTLPAMSEFDTLAEVIVGGLRDTMNSLSFEDEKRAIPLIFNYMYR